MRICATSLIHTVTELPKCTQADFDGKSDPRTKLVETVRLHSLRDDWNHQHSGRSHYYPREDALGDTLDGGHLRLHNAHFVTVLGEYWNTPCDLSLPHDREIYHIASSHRAKRSESLRRR